MPETHALALGWPLDEKAQQEIDDKKRKPSKEIRVEAARQMVAFTQTTQLGPKGQVVLIHPADRMNTVTANALLKTLEEPPGNTRFVLTTDALHQLLPTIRSRCQSHAMELPPTSEALPWLVGQGVPEDQAEVLWRASGGRPSWVLDRVKVDAMTAEQWRQWPRQIARGQAGLLEQLSATEGLDSLQKLCHDLLAVAHGAAPQFFLPDQLPKSPSATKAAAWAEELSRMVRHVEHPFNAGLQIQAWAVRARQAMRPD
jgi:DNA polymerase-3 subunit delta'